MLETLGNLGDFIGGIAVIITLIYLTVQIRRNTATVQATAIESATRAVWEFMELLAKDRELLQLYMAGSRDFESLSEEDRIRFSSLVGALLHRMENMVAQTRIGLLPETAWQGSLNRVKGTFAQPGTLQWWERGKHAFNEDLRRWVESEVIGD